MNLNQFINEEQLKTMRSFCRGEEGEHFQQLIRAWKLLIATMPKTYETENENDPLCQLHYFKGGSDWYITERDIDADGEGQIQAFGFACLNEDHENAELGYISIKELIENGVEFDLYYRPETLKTVKARYGKYTKTNLDTWMEEGCCPAEGCPEGCFVELDGRCSHGYESVMLNMGLI